MALKTDGFQNLVPEMREHLLGFLDPRTLFYASSVSAEWRRLISPLTNVWRRVCKAIIHVKDDIERGKFCRAFFVRLSERRRLIGDRSECFMMRGFSGERMLYFTAIYYYGGKLATGSEDGTIHLWDCVTFWCLWTSRRVTDFVTSLKFDENILLASYYDGSIVAWDLSTGDVKRRYLNTCDYAATVDFMTDANLVVSAHKSVRVWNMTTGLLLITDSIRYIPAVKIAIGPFPGQECESSCPTVRKLLVATSENNYIVLRVATSTRVNESDIEVHLEKLTAICIQCRSRYCAVLYDVLRPGFVYDGEFLYFIRHSSVRCTGIMCKWDVMKGRIVDRKNLSNNVRAVLAVGKKYTLVVTFRDVNDSDCSDHLVVLDTENARRVVSFPVPGRLQRIWTPSSWMSFHGPDNICVGEKSWLDGFDGDNDRGLVYSSIMNVNDIYTLHWSLRKNQRPYEAFRMFGLLYLRE